VQVNIIKITDILQTRQIPGRTLDQNLDRYRGQNPDQNPAQNLEIIRALDPVQNHLKIPENPENHAQNLVQDRLVKPQSQVFMRKLREKITCSAIKIVTDVEAGQTQVQIRAVNVGGITIKERTEIIEVVEIQVAGNVESSKKKPNNAP
jgi:hypothetical protein